MYKRSTLKKAARKSVKKHYFFLLLVCLLSTIIGATTRADLSFLDYFGQDAINSEKQAVHQTIEDFKNNKTDEAIDRIIRGDEAGGKDIFDQLENIEKNSGRTVGIVEIGSRRGVLAQVVNSVASGKLFYNFYSAFKTLTGSTNWGLWICVFLSVILALAFFMFIQNIYEVVTARICLEGREYKKIPFSRFVFIIKVKRWIRSACTMMLRLIFWMLWALTIVGGVIKYFSYAMTPYIVAENPDIKPCDAITLSRKMMHGHKWQYFVFSLSFWYWYVLGVLTLGITNVLYFNSYRATAGAEFYAYIRKEAYENNVENIEACNDKYLYELAAPEVVNDAYSDIVEIKDSFKMPPKRKGVRGFFENWFGITLSYDKKEKEFRKAMVIQSQIDSYKDIIDGNEYPTRLFSMAIKEKKKKSDTMIQLRHYSVYNLILIFFVGCLIGWLWEVSLHMFNHGVFVNRGTMMGPWIPIYGGGCVAILVVLYKLRKWPFAIFVASFGLCGIIEYAAGRAIELETGLRYWDYTGYFLNINGYICAEGLLIFGLAGVAATYIIAPMLDNLFNKMPKGVSISLAATLTVLFIADAIYVKYHPNVQGMCGEARAIFLWSDKKGDHFEERKIYYDDYPKDMEPDLEYIVIKYKGAEIIVIPKTPKEKAVYNKVLHEKEEIDRKNYYEKLKKQEPTAGPTKKIEQKETKKQKKTKKKEKEKTVAPTSKVAAAQ